jgi:hypothetical protein
MFAFKYTLVEYSKSFFVKGKFVSNLNQAVNHEDICGSAGKAPQILNLSN